MHFRIVIPFHGKENHPLDLFGEVSLPGHTASSAPQVLRPRNRHPEKTRGVRTKLFATFPHGCPHQDIIISSVSMGNHHVGARLVATHISHQQA